MTTDLVFLDTETTGLDSDIHEIWEVAYAVGEGPIKTVMLNHELHTADPQALAMNGYYQRGRLKPVWLDELVLKDVVTGNTLVGANIGFDARFLKARWKSEPWHYRTIDVESMALAILGYDRPKGLNDIAEDLVQLDYDIPLPDHSAAADVETTRKVFYALRDLQGRKEYYMSEAEARNTPPYS